MRKHALINTLNTARQMAIGKIESIDEQLFHVQPPQFNNTIAWNVGHIITTMDSLVFQRATQASKLSPEFVALFKGGTKPADWTAAPPTKAEFIDLLTKQLNDLNEAFADQMDTPLPAPVQIRQYTFETVGDILGFAIFHEGQHLAIAGDIAKAIQFQNNK